MTHDLLRGDHGLVIPFWHVRLVQPGKDGFLYFTQAVPIGVWPARFAWVAEGHLDATGVTLAIQPFDEQDAWFREVGRGSQLLARREPLVLREPLPQEWPLAWQLGRLQPSYRGVPVREFRELRRRVVAAAACVGV